MLHRSLNESDDLARLGALLAAQSRLLPPGLFALAAVISSTKPHANIPLVAGNDVHKAAIYERCLREVREMIRRGDRGFAAHPTEHVISPDWVEGETLPPVVALRP